MPAYSVCPILARKQRRSAVCDMVTNGVPAAVVVRSV